VDHARLRPQDCLDQILLQAMRLVSRVPCFLANSAVNRRCSTIANSSPEKPAILCLRMGLLPNVPHPVGEILPWQKLPWLRDKLEGLRNETFAEGDVPPLVQARMEARLH
jgi:hypothetical protein